MPPVREGNEERAMNVIPWNRQTMVELKECWHYLAWAALFVAGLAWALNSMNQ
jgi:hypothetical protein